MKKKILMSLALSSTLVLFFSACKKDEDNSPPADANVMIVNASPGSPSQELYLNDTKASNQAVAYSQNSIYVPAPPKQYNVKIAAVNSISPVAEMNVGINEGRSYSIFAYDTLLNGKMKVFTVDDDLSDPPSGKAKVRFLHLSPGNLAVDIAANDVIVFDNRSYADNVTTTSKASFKTMDAGTYTIAIRLAGSNSSIPAIVSIPNVSIAAGKIYTIYAKGLVTGSGQNALGASLIVNK